ncbi:MAG: hypothetical protein ACREXP_28150, partial [Steroidobacteraceae bacterium]
IGTLTGRADTDNAALNAWAKRHTGGLIERLPLATSSDTLAALASALAIELRWRLPFAEARHIIDEGPWADAGPIVRLTRTSPDLDDLRVVSTPTGPVCAVTIRGTGDTGVVLALGDPEQAAGDVLSAAIDGLRPDAPHRNGSQLIPGERAPGLSVRDVPSTRPGRELILSTVGFDISETHNLVEHANLFGLVAARQEHLDNFPGIGSGKLRVDGAVQAATAAFSATGFIAAAVTAFDMIARSAELPRPKPALIRRVELDLSRPFGFVAMHRPSCLALMTGWVGRPQPWPSASESGRSS